MFRFAAAGRDAAGNVDRICSCAEVRIHASDRNRADSTQNGTGVPEKVYSGCENRNGINNDQSQKREEGEDEANANDVIREQFGGID